MLETVKAYYDGTNVVIDEDNNRRVPKGELVKTYTVTEPRDEVESRAERRRKFIESGAGVIPSGRSADEIDAYIRSLRDTYNIYPCAGGGQGESDRKKA